MILNVSGRTDIVAFYSNWFMNRLKEGYVLVRNPYYKTLVSKIYFKDVDAIVFCTKNPIPILDKLDDIKIPFIFHVTLTPYKKDIEPNVPPKGLIINAIKKLSEKIGKNKLWIRYDPVFINDYYTVDYHIRNFDNMCKLLSGYVNKIIISFLDMYQNVRYNMPYLRAKKLTDEDYEKIGTNFALSAKKYNMTVQTCAEKRNLKEYGFLVSDCVTKEIAKDLTKKDKFKKWTARGKCSCVSMVDIGEYNTCKHMCKYCYANYDENAVFKNVREHSDLSPMLTGNVTQKDSIKERKD